MGCKKNMIKLLLVVFNVVAVIIGLALIGVGGYARLEYGEILSVTHDSYTNIPVVMMVLGLIIFILGFFGCFGSYKESRVLLIIYSVLLIVVIMGEMVAIVVSMIFKGKVGEEVATGLTDNYNAYIDGDEDAMGLIDDVQDSLKCCGLHDTSTWTNNTKWNTDYPDDEIPVSCCVEELEEGAKCYANMTLTAFYEEGCFDKATRILDNNLALIIGLTCAFLFIQLVGVCLGCTLCKRIARDGYKEV